MPSVVPRHELDMLQFPRAIIINLIETRSVAFFASVSACPINSKFSGRILLLALTARLSRNIAEMFEESLHSNDWTPIVITQQRQKQA